MPCSPTGQLCWKVFGFDAGRRETGIGSLKIQKISRKCHQCESGRQHCCQAPGASCNFGRDGRDNSKTCGRRGKGRKESIQTMGVRGMKYKKFLRAQRAPQRNKYHGLCQQRANEKSEACGGQKLQCFTHEIHSHPQNFFDAKKALSGGARFGASIFEQPDHDGERGVRSKRGQSKGAIGCRWRAPEKCCMRGSRAPRHRTTASRAGFEAHAGRARSHQGIAPLRDQRPIWVHSRAQSRRWPNCRTGRDRGHARRDRGSSATAPPARQ